MAKKEDKKDDKVMSPEEQLNRFMHENKSEHLNFEETVSYKVSSGSLNVDLHTNGGLPSGLHRFTGIAEGGKTSESLEVMANFFESVKDSRGVLFKAEGRLTEEMKKRTRLTFVYDPKDWKDGTCFVYEGNVFESVNALMRDLVFNNPGKKRYMFILDSMDALMLRKDLEKSEDEANKVAGGALLSSDLMKRIGQRLTKLGHIAIFISQVRSTIQIDQKSAREVRATSSSGGHAMTHYANFVFEFQPNFFGGSLILEDDDKKPHPVNNKILGHKVKIMVRKSSNEITGMPLEYPVKHGQMGGCSIWKEYEIADMLLIFEHAKKDGKWFKVNQEAQLIKDLMAKVGDVPDKFDGLNKLITYLEKTPAVTDFLYARYKKVVAGTA